MSELALLDQKIDKPPVNLIRKKIQKREQTTNIRLREGTLLQILQILKNIVKNFILINSRIKFKQTPGPVP